MDTEAKIFYYLGANTPVGFYSLYDELIDLERARDVRILKGGPGCGKSTLMRQVGEAMEERGHTVEYIRCSGDPDSLDGVVIPALGAAVVDGTAPHVIEPRYPGLVERYVDLGAFCDRAALRGAETELKACMKSYKACYRRAYRCLTAAAQLEEDMLALLLVPGLEAKLAKRARGILSREVRREGEQEGRVVRRFLGGVTWKGVLREYGTVEAQCGRVYELTDPYGLAHPMLTCLAAGATAAGHDVVACPDPLFPDRLAHLLIPALSLAFVSTTREQPWPGRPYRRIRLDAMADPELLRRSRGRLRFSRKVADALTAEAVEALGQAKAGHDAVEAVYRPSIDFDGVRVRGEEIIRDFLRLEEHAGSGGDPQGQTERKSER